MKRSSSPAEIALSSTPPAPASGCAPDAVVSKQTKVRKDMVKKMQYDRTRSCELPSERSMASANYTSRGEAARQFRSRVQEITHGALHETESDVMDETALARHDTRRCRAKHRQCIEDGRCMYKDDAGLGLASMQEAKECKGEADARCW